MSRKLWAGVIKLLAYFDFEFVTSEGMKLKEHKIKRESSMRYYGHLVQALGDVQGKVTVNCNSWSKPDQITLFDFLAESPGCFNQRSGWVRWETNLGKQYIMIQIRSTGPRLSTTVEISSEIAHCFETEWNGKEFV